MVPCLIIGDSIALGIAAALTALQAPVCDVRARTGASTAAIASMAPPKLYRTIIVSAGSNDRGNQTLDRELERLRSKLLAAKIIWIYPFDRAGAWSVYRIAYHHGDRTADLTRIGSLDGVHPRDYKAAAALIAGVRRRDPYKGSAFSE